MEKILNERERDEAFNKILNKENKYSRDEISLYIKGLSELEKAGVLKYAEDKKTGAMDFINRFRELNPNNKNYPYTNDYKFRDAITVIVRMEIQNLPEQLVKTKPEILKTNLVKFGFYKLPLVNKLSDEGKGTLIELISSNDLPYCIAFFDYLGFIKYLDKEHFNTNYKRNKEISNWFDASEDSVKKNINVLDKGSEAMKRRYTSHIHKDTVNKDYQELK